MDWERMLNRNRWYMCFEKVYGLSYPISIYRRYHQVDTIPANQWRPWEKQWTEGYAHYGIEITSILHQFNPMWDKQIIDYMIQYGAKHFRHLNIWDVNWNEKAEQLGIKHDKSFADPRLQWEKAVNRWLMRTQSKQNKGGVHLLEKILMKIYK